MDDGKLTKKAGGLRFHCAIPGCQGVVPSGANLWEHALEHEAQAGLAALITPGVPVGAPPAAPHQCQGCGTPFPFAWLLQGGFCRKCKL